MKVLIISVDPDGIIQAGAYVDHDYLYIDEKFKGYPGTRHVVKDPVEQDQCLIGKPAPAKYRAPTTEQSSVDRK